MAYKMLIESITFFQKFLWFKVVQVPCSLASTGRVTLGNGIKEIEAKTCIRFTEVRNGQSLPNR